MQFIHVGSKQYAEKNQKRNTRILRTPFSPRLWVAPRAVAAGEATLASAARDGCALLVSPQQHAFMDHDLHYVLSYC
ncbi:hypothetical protein EVAR_91842_1 [Eumeta japonica]|uniref:Uncharacterized protein n=1 Tax=Eumeta variegata TaxID=151549 RepID=A0A4C2ADD3_EUMVA|nr:hypothetical protein EVAR_91842_1 [Eumeta japonica]